ncbi:MAG: type II secretion system F family protein [bacterium]|nr:type II secretion system F family protein [bacterium]
MDNQNIPNQDPNMNNNQNVQNAQNVQNIQNVQGAQSVQNVQNQNPNNRQNLKADTVAKKKKYKYVIQNAKGKKVNGFLDAYTKKEVASYLQNEGYSVLKVEEQNSILSMELGNRKLSYAELAFLLTQLSTYLKAGIPLIDSIRILEKQSVKPEKKRVYSNIIYELSKGESFSNALTAQGTVFPPLLINMVRTAELTGDLPEILDDMQEYYDSIDKTHKAAVSAMIYPTILFIFAMCVLVFIMAYVIPNFVTLFEQQNAELPAVTKVVMAISSFIVNYKYWLIGIILVISVVGFLMYKHIKGFRKTLQTIIMKLPGFGNIVIYREVTMFTKTFASLLNHNVFITDSMEILGSVSNNEVFKDIINDSLDYLSKGAKISDAFEDKWAFPIVAYEMLVTGENTGRLPMMMSYVADYYGDLHANTVKRINTFIEPLMIIMIAVIVGIVVISVVVPMFDFYGTVL